jgi:glycosyltransferase involved in cell wall biosynthesis
MITPIETSGAQLARERASASPRLAIVVPCYNESEVLNTSIDALTGLLRELQDGAQCSDGSFVVFVDDGSSDTTWDLIDAAATRWPGRVHGLRLARNAGHQYALLAGLTYVSDKCDAAISIDADLQDDLAALPQMLGEYRKGAEIVLGVKEARAPDPLFKKITAAGFYKLMHWLGVQLTENHADCRLMSARALRNLNAFPEYVLFLRGLQPLLHRRISTVTYAISPRAAGHSKYTLGKMLALAWNGITSFSIVPLRLITFSGAFVFVVSLGFAVNALIEVAHGNAVTGWASITVPLYLLGGLLMLSIGIVGEYVGKIFLEAKRRPRYLVDDIVNKG